MGDASYSDNNTRDMPIINIQVSIVEGNQDVFAVPSDIVDIRDKLNCSKRCNLSEFIEIDNSTNPK